MCNESFIVVIVLPEKTINDCSDVISNNSSGIGTANSSDFNESSFAMKTNESFNSSNSGKFTSEQVVLVIIATVVYLYGFLFDRNARRQFQPSDV